MGRIETSNAAFLVAVILFSCACGGHDEQERRLVLPDGGVLTFARDGGTQASPYPLPGGSGAGGEGGQAETGGVGGGIEDGGPPDTGAGGGGTGGGSGQGGDSGYGGGAGQDGGSGYGGYGGGSGQGGSGGSVSEPVSNSPLATITVTPFSTTAEDLYLISSNFVVSPSGGEYFEQWWAVVGNAGIKTLCHIEAEVDFKIGGVLAAEHYGFADADRYQAGIDMPIACIAPGEIGVVYDNGFVATAVAVDSITAIEVILEGQDYGTTVPHPLAPEVISGEVFEPYGTGTGFWAVRGAVYNGAGTIYNIGMSVYPMTSQSLAFDWLLDHHLETFSLGSTWNYETTATDIQSYVDYAQYIDFLPGSGGSSRLVFPPTPAPAPAAVSPVSELESTRRAHRQATGERLNMFRQSR